MASIACLTACSSPSDSASPGAQTADSRADASSAASAANKSPAPGSAFPGLGQVPTLPISITATYPFGDPAAPPFVQGLEFEPDGSLLVGTGLYGQSTIYRLRDWAHNQSATPTEVNDLSPDLFGEGITRHGDRLWQLTWKEGKAIERDASSLGAIRDVPLETEGWGTCSFDDSIVTSDGSGTLTLRDPSSFAPTKRIDVSAGGQPTTWLNELECVDTGTGREVWANVWQSPYIYRIDAASGDVTGIVDAQPLINDLLSRVSEEQRQNVDVLNGIALIPGSDEGARNEADGHRQFLLTGKKWPLAYRVDVGDGVGKRE
nr:glutaminyl-peptide cyclotransferase [Corynebacterium lactis]